MDVGDLVRWQDKLWIVRKIDEAVATSFLESEDGATDVMDQDGDIAGLCQVVCNPVRDWPSAPLPSKRSARLTGVSFSGRPLVRFRDWVKLDEFQIGGVLLLNPELRFGYRDRLTVTYEMSGSGRTSGFPVEIPRNFASLGIKQRRHERQQALNAPPPPPKPPTVFDLLREEKDDD
jgi:hypothetical protein